MRGTIKQLFSSLGVSGHRDKRRRRKQQLQTVELKIGMDCDGCEQEVRKALSGVRGVHSVEVSRRQQKVTVTGDVDPHKVLKKAQATGKSAEMWPQNPGIMAVAHRHGAQAYDRWATTAPAYVRSVEAINTEHITTLFSDDNPNACSIM